MADDAMLTIRWTRQMHAAFRELAHQRRDSMNSVAIAVLLREVEESPAARSVLYGSAPASGSNLEN